MKTTIRQQWRFTAIAVAAYMAGFSGQAVAQDRSRTVVEIGDADLGGVVSSPNGPEAGVWVIAETTDLPTQQTESPDFRLPTHQGFESRRLS